MGARANVCSLLILAALGCGSPLPDPGIVRGADLLQKSLFLEKTELGDVRSISVETFGPGADVLIIVAGTKAAAFVTTTGEVQRLVRFQDEMMTPVPIDIEGDGTLEFMDRGGGWQPVSVVSHDGRTLWRYEGRDLAAPNEMDAGDVDGDGLLEFVIGLNGSGGVVCCDHRGTTRWTAGGSNVFSVALLDVDADGMTEVVHTTGSTIAVRDASGKVVATLRPGFCIFATVSWPDPGATRRLMGEAHGQLQIVDPGGTVLARFDASDLWGASPATPVPLAPGRPYFAVGSTIRVIERRSRLKVFDPDAALVYEEVFDSADLPVAGIGDDGTGSGRLLVGSGSRVWSLRRR
jgi:hypothetical protein